jgi:23S rRNA-/tRNA-specific pseudouridylate synthase
MYGGRFVYPWQLEDKPAEPQEPLISRPALHAWRMEITHPATNKLMKFEAPVPEDMLLILEELRKFRKIK